MNDQGASASSGGSKGGDETVKISLPFSRSAVESGNVIADALISIGPSAKNEGVIQVPRIAEGSFPRLLRLSFDDVPCAYRVDRHARAWYGPGEADVAAALSFARSVHRDDPQAFIAVHCEQGRSRSAAIALMIVADRLGAGSETEAVRRLLEDDVDGVRCFNPLIVRLADQLLSRHERLESALAELCPAFVRWRRYWIEKAALPVQGGA